MRCCLERRGVARGWDGSGHNAIGTLYDQVIFPNTFGWTGAYCGGMPFPNFYPPLFYWLVALLHHTHLVSFSTALKITSQCSRRIHFRLERARDKGRAVAESTSLTFFWDVEAAGAPSRDDVGKMVLPFVRTSLISMTVELRQYTRRLWSSLDADRELWSTTDLHQSLPIALHLLIVG